MQLSKGYKTYSSPVLLDGQIKNDSVYAQKFKHNLSYRAEDAEIQRNRTISCPMPLTKCEGDIRQLQSYNGDENSLIIKQKQLLKRQYENKLKQTQIAEMKESYAKFAKQLDVMLNDVQVPHQRPKSSKLYNASQLNYSYQRLNVLFQLIQQLDVQFDASTDLQQEIKKNITEKQVALNILLECQRQLDSDNYSLQHEIDNKRTTIEELQCQKTDQTSISDSNISPANSAQQHHDVSITSVLTTQLQNDLCALHDSLTLNLQKIQQFLSEKEKRHISSLFNSKFDDIGVNDEYHCNQMKKQLQEIFQYIDEINQKQATYDIHQMDLENLTKEADRLDAQVKNLQKQNFHITKINKEVERELCKSADDVIKYQQLHQEKLNQLLQLQQQYKKIAQK